MSWKNTGDVQLHAEARDLATSAQRLETLSADPTLRLVVAGNPAAPAELLERLAQDADAQVRQAVAGNPNTPWKTLEHLAPEFPRAFLHNPVGPVQMLAYPEQISNDEALWGALLREASIPTPWWNWLLSKALLSTSEPVRLHVQYAGEAPCFYGILQQERAETLLTLADILTVACDQGVTLPALTNGLQVNSSTTTCEQIIRDHLAWLASCTDKRVRVAAIANPRVPVEALRTLALDPDQLEGVRWIAAEHVQTPVEVLRLLALDEDEWVRDLVASNERTPAAVLQSLAQDQDSRVRTGVARNSRAPVETLRLLAQDEEKEARTAVARHQMTPLETLQVLVQDQDASVRSAMAGNPRVPSELLRVLAQDLNEQVRRVVAGNERTPVESLQMLARNQEEWVRSAVAGNPRISQATLRILALDPDAIVRSAAARNPQTSPEMLQMLAQDPDEMVRQSVASHSQSSVEVLQMLAQDPNERVRQMVVSHPHSPMEVLQMLAQDPDKKVQLLASLVLRVESEVEEQWRQGAWREQLRWLLLEIHDIGWILTMPIDMQLERVARMKIFVPVRQTIVALLAAHWDPARSWMRLDSRWPSLATTLHTRRENCQLFLDSSLPPVALQKLAASLSWEVRYLVALHPQTPQETRQRLCQDGNRYVRALAGARTATKSEVTGL